MKRYYLSDVIGSGTRDDPYRPAAARLARSWAAVIKSSNAGTPLLPHCLALVGADDHAALIADAANTPLPDYPLDAKVSAMHEPTRLRLIADLEAHGLPTGFLNGTNGYREVIRRVGQHYDPAFDENRFSVSE